MATEGAGKLFKEITNLEKAKEVQNHSQDLIIPGNEKTGFLNLPSQGYINMKHLIIREMKLVHLD